MPRYFRPKGAFVTVDKDGVNRLFARDPIPDALVPEGHWVLKDRAELFEEFLLDELVKLDASTPVSVPLVEQATKAPGEKRAAKRAG
jgi:hypothetical protein